MPTPRTLTLPVARPLPHRGRPGRWLLITLALGALACCCSLAIGARSIPLPDVWTALTSYDPANADHAVVHSRLQRTVAGLAVGAALAVAGAAMQGLTRNPLADPGILGLNSGAAAAVVAGIYFFSISTVPQFIAFAFAGAAVATLLVYAIASRGSGGATPVKLALTGAALTAGFSSLVSALVLIDQNSLDRLRVWEVGALGARSLTDTGIVALFMIAGLVPIALLTPTLNSLALGDDAATGLGVNVARARLIMGTAIVLLAGGAVALAGPIGFLGLVVPHAVRLVAGSDYRAIVPLCLVSGPILILAADTVGRVISPPAEVQVGVMTALLGVPVFISLIRQRRQVGL